MKIIKKILITIYEPFKMVSNRVNADKATKFFNHHKEFVYLIAVIITFITVALIYKFL